MSMFCYQCQETAKGTGCTIKGVCGKTDDVANLQDLLIFTLKGISIYSTEARKAGIENPLINHFIMESLFTTITNANFDKESFIPRIKKALVYRSEMKTTVEKAGIKMPEVLHESASWYADTVEAFEEKAKSVGVLVTENEDIRSLRQLIIYGIKGMAAYAEHGFNNYRQRVYGPILAVI